MAEFRSNCSVFNVEAEVIMTTILDRVCFVVKVFSYC